MTAGYPLGDGNVSSEAERFVCNLRDGTRFREVPRVARKTLHAIASFMSENVDRQGRRRVCFASQRAIARRLGLSERTVRQHLRLLERQGIISVNRQSFGSQGRGGIRNIITIVGFSDQAETAPLSGSSKRKKTADQAAVSAAHRITHETITCLGIRRQPVGIMISAETWDRLVSALSPQMPEEEIRSWAYEWQFKLAGKRFHETVTRVIAAIAKGNIGNPRSYFESALMKAALATPTIERAAYEVSITASRAVASPQLIKCMNGHGKATGT